ncbi:MAG TPA: hypothetical protein VN031_01585 [Candidatus Microsaccharimonas sp.]|nr:hypothetical protein [Candidatus Microsaccharimonas sp.]
MKASNYSAFVPSGTPHMEGPVTLLEPGEIPAPQDGLYSGETLEAIRAIERGSYALLPGSFDMKSLDIVEIGGTALFNELPDLGRTRENNKSGLEFGQLLVSSPFGDERVELVAQKPFEHPREAATEFSLSSHFSSRNSQPTFRTFKPLGFSRLDDGTLGMLTKYEHGVRSLDNVFLNPEFEDSATVVHRAVGKCAYLLASMHAEGYTHGDAQVKNMFVSNFDQIFIADLVSLRPFPHNNGETKVLPTSIQIDRDLNTLIHSMQQAEDGKRELPPQIREMFALIYTSIVNAPKSEVPEDIRKSHNQIGEFFDPDYIAS